MNENDRLEISGFELGIETFVVNSYKCHLKIDKLDDGTELLTVEDALKEQLYYSFNGMDGLCQTTKFGTVRDKNLILGISSLDLNDRDSVLEFFSENGFLFRNSDKVSSYEYEGFRKILERIRALTAIISELSKSRQDDKELIAPVLYLLLGDDAELIRMGTEQPIYKSKPHPAIKTVRDTTIAVNTDIDTEEAERKGTYSVRDTIYPDVYELNAEKYDSIIAGEDPWDDDNEELSDEIYRKIASAYKLNHGLNRSSRCIIDFLFHFMLGVGVVKKATSPSEIIFYKDVPEIKLDEPMKKALTNVARAVATYEINSVITVSVRPMFLESKFETTWRATSLHAALYFSLFYMRPGKTIFKRCENPSCNRYFSVASTNGRKKYCGKKCRDACNSRLHRQREKEKEQEAGD